MMCDLPASSSQGWRLQECSAMPGMKTFLGPNPWLRVWFWKNLTYNNHYLNAHIRYLLKVTYYLLNGVCVCVCESNLATRAPVCNICLNLRKHNYSQSIEKHRKLDKGIEKFDIDAESLQRHVSNACGYHTLLIPDIFCSFCSIYPHLLL